MLFMEYHDRWVSRASRALNPKDGGTTGASPGVTTPRKSGDSALKIYVGNLSFDTNEDSLRNAFAAHGDVEEVAVITDRDTGRPRGFAFVTMPDSAARTAIDALNGQELDGRTLNVNEAKAKTSRGGGGGGGGGGGQRRGGW